MTRHIQDPATGRMRGSLGSGKTAIPTAQEPAAVRSLAQDPNQDPKDSDGSWGVMYEHYRSPEQWPEEAVTLFDVVGESEYRRSLEAGFIRVQRHPEYPYLIHNYTEACTWEGAWNDATLMCRGLITHADTGVIVARPFRKFFNHDQPGAPLFDLDRDVVVTDKADGSLGIIYPTPHGEFAVATRGSFTSDQAIWATQLLRDRYASKFHPEPGVTYLAEIIAPFNRVVVDYGATEDLLLLGAVNTRTGKSLTLEEASRAWPGSTVEIHEHTTLRHVLEAPARENAEGFVLWDPQTDERIKYKYEDYKRLHRYLTSTTPRHVWEVLSRGENPGEVFAAAPDEFHVWLKDVSADLAGRHAAAVDSATQEFKTLVARLPQGWQRKDFAQAAANSDNKTLLFMLLDGKPIDEHVWKGLRPTGQGETVRAVSGASD